MIINSFEESAPAFVKVGEEMSKLDRPCKVSEQKRSAKKI